jgi:hypothetical protein
MITIIQQQISKKQKPQKTNKQAHHENAAFNERNPHTTQQCRINGKEPSRTQTVYFDVFDTYGVNRFIHYNFFLLITD